MFWIRPFLAVTFVVLALCCKNSYAFVKTNVKSNPNSPSILKADSIEGNQETNIYTADGNAELRRDSSVIYADKLRYDKNNGKINAIGHVLVKNLEIGNIVASGAEVSDDFLKGTFKDMTLVLVDGAYLRSPQVDRRSKDIIILQNAIYSICPNVEISANNDLAGKNRDLFSIKSKNVTVDQTKQIVKIRGAIIRLYDVPFLYTPYLQAPLPSNKKESGFLTPSYIKNNKLGFGIKMPYYLYISPSKDLTINPSISLTTGSIVVANNFKALTDYGYYQSMLELANNEIDFSNDLTIVKRTSSPVRAQLKARGAFDYTINSGVDFDINTVTDRNYLRDYHNDHAAYSLSSINADYINKRDYYAVKTIRFQELENPNAEKTAQFILPRIDTHFESKKPIFYKEKYIFSSNTVVINRDVGMQYRRISLTPEVNLPLNFYGNLVAIDGKMQGDFYSITNGPNNDVVASSGSTNFDSFQSNFKPEVSINWRLPIMKKTESNTFIIEPMANFVSSASKKRFSKLPNEDGNFFSYLSISNLFASNRISGFDRSETGERLTYGVRSTLFNSFGEYGLAFGQSVRKNVNDQQDVIIAGFNSNNKSNIIGETYYKMTDRVMISYAFHLNEKNYRNELNEVITIVNFGKISFNNNYVLLRKNNQNLIKREQMISSAVWNINEKWQATFGFTRDMVVKRNIASSLGVSYYGCCTTFGVVVTENNAINLITPERSVSLSIGFRNL